MLSRSKITWLLTGVLALFSSPIHLHGQVATPDPLIKELQDSINRLEARRKSQDSVISSVGNLLPLPDFVDINSVPVGDRAHIEIELSSPGILRAVLHRQSNNAPIDTVIRTEFARTHNLSFNELSTPGSYYVDVRLLKFDGTASERFRTGRGGTGHHPRLRVTTAGPSALPIPIVRTPSIRGTVVEIAVETTVPTLIQGRLHRTNAVGGRMPDTIAISGAAFITNAVTGVPKTTPSSRTATLRFAGLDSMTQYFYTVEAMDANGRRASMPGDLGTFTTSRNPVEFAFGGPVNIRVNPALGLVLQWTATAPADTGRVRIIGSSGGAWRGVKLSPDRKTLTATVPTSLPGDTTATPVFEVEMTGAGGAAVRQMKFTIGLETPTPAQVNGIQNSAAKTAVEDLTQAMTKKDSAVDWNRVLRTGAGLLLKALPALVP